MAPGREMTLGAAVEAPSGFVSLCMRSPVDCVQTDTPQARAGAVLQARSIARASWQRAIARAAAKGLIETPAPAPASIGAPNAVTGQTSSAAAALSDPSSPPAPSVTLPTPAPTPQAGPSAAPNVTAPTPAIVSEAATPVLDAQTDKVALDVATWSKLVRINTFVNRAIRPASDLEVYGVSDWWAAPLSSGQAPFGDCKAYVLEKRRELIAAGIPGSALSIAVVRTPWRELHAVLVVATEDGDLVLDNLNRDIRPWTQTAYTWEARQSPSDPLVWQAVQGQPSKTAKVTVALNEPAANTLLASAAAP